jgi:23S rRNA pseudouridine1911/1915/1917 synthase
MNTKHRSAGIGRGLFERFRFDIPKGQLLLRIDKYLMNMIRMQPEIKFRMQLQTVMFM